MGHSKNWSNSNHTASGLRSTHGACTVKLALESGTHNELIN